MSLTPIQLAQRYAQDPEFASRVDQVQDLRFRGKAWVAFRDPALRPIAELYQNIDDAQRKNIERQIAQEKERLKLAQESQNFMTTKQGIVDTRTNKVVAPVGTSPSKVLNLAKINLAKINLANNSKNLITTQKGIVDTRTNKVVAPIGTSPINIIAKRNIQLQQAKQLLKPEKNKSEQQIINKNKPTNIFSISSWEKLGSDLLKSKYNKERNIGQKILTNPLLFVSTFILNRSTISSHKSTFLSFKSSSIPVHLSPASFMFVLRNILLLNES